MNSTAPHDTDTQSTDAKISDPPPLGIFEAYGIEIEYAVVKIDSLDIHPCVDTFFHGISGTSCADIEHPDITWSNELVNHVLELKGTQPFTNLEGAEKQFQKHIQLINSHLGKGQHVGDSPHLLAAMLLPTGMHPTMHPETETILWPGENSEIYQTFNRLFNCSGHGWANLQSTHLNLPYRNDEEFVRLHSAIRAVLPLIPALCASSPFVEGKLTGVTDNRLRFYRSNCARLPSVAGKIIPDYVNSVDEYRNTVYAAILAELKEHSAADILEPEWTNSRGAILRPSRNSIEVRLLDTQECPKADLAICALIVAILKALVAETWSPFSILKSQSTAHLREILDYTIIAGDQAVIKDANYLSLFYPANNLPHSCTAQELLSMLFSHLESDLTYWGETLEVILNQGCLARRICAAHSACEGSHIDSTTNIYRRLANCLAEGTMFMEGAN